MGVIPEECCCTCADLLGVGTQYEINVGDSIRVFTSSGGTGSIPFEGTLLAVEDNAIVVDEPGSSTDFVRFCCAHITTIVRVSAAAPAKK